MARVASDETPENIRRQVSCATAYDIAGSAHWRNKADNILSVWRDVSASDDRVQVHVQKIRFRGVGRVGKIELVFDPLTGRFQECEGWPYPPH